MVVHMWQKMVISEEIKVERSFLNEFVKIAQCENNGLYIYSNMFKYMNW